MPKFTSASKVRARCLLLEKLEDRTNPGAGALDPTFGGDHKVTTAISSLDDRGYSVAIQADGKIIIAGSGNGVFSVESDFALARYNVDGSLDASFSGDGKLTTSFGSYEDIATSVAIQADGKILVAGFSSVDGVNSDFALARYNADGSLDTSFSVDGKLTTGIGTSDDHATSMVIQGDGKIVLAGFALNGSDYDFAVVRYNTDGSLDTSFNGDGKLTTSLGSGDDFARAVALQADGKFVVAGSSDSGSGNQFALARYNPTGSLDSSFDGDGKLTTPIGSSDDVVNSVAIQADGKIVAAGTSYSGSDNDFALARFSANGSLDSTFDGDGKVTTPFDASDDFANGLAIQADGKLVVAGQSDGGSGSTFALARYGADGSLDSSFDGDGKLTTPIGSSDAAARGVAIQVDNKIVVAGGSYDDSNSKYNFTLVRYDSDGRLDSLAAGNGKVTTDFGALGATAQSVAIQADGKIVVAGDSGNGSNPSISDFAVARYNQDGSLDTSFSGDGKLTTDFGSGYDSARGVAIQADGKIVVVGSASNGSNHDFALARYNTDGTLDTTFGGTGKLTTDFFTLHDDAYAVVVQPDGRIVVAGSTQFSGKYYFAIACYNSDGVLDSTFSNDGLIGYGFSGTSTEVATSLAIQADGKLVVAGYSNVAGNYDFYLMRLNGDGSSDTSFNGGGGVITDFASGNDYVQAVAIQADGKIVVAGAASNGSNNDFALARYNVDGSLDSSFDGDGKLTTPVGLGYDYAEAVAIQADGKLVAGGFSAIGSTFDFALVRYNPDGSLDTSFDFDGKLTTSVGAEGFILSVAIQSDGKIVAAGKFYNGTVYDIAIIRVRGDNHAPVALPAAMNLAEDSVLHVSSPTYFAEPDGDAVATTLLTGPAHGTLAFTAYGTFTYTPNPNFFGTDSFTYKVEDLDGASDIGVITLNVFNDAADRLELVASPGVVTFSESVPAPSTPVVVDAGIQVGTALEGIITSATVKFASGYVPKRDTLTFATTGAIKGKFNVKTGTLTLTGAATPAEYQAALRSVKYSNNSPQPVDGFRTITIQLTDAAGTGDAATRLLQVIGVNTKAILTPSSVGLNYMTRGRGLAVASTLKITDLDNTRLMGATISIGAGFVTGRDVLSVKTKTGITANYDGVTGILTLTGNATLKDYQAVLRSLKFTTSVGAAAGLRTLFITVNDGLSVSDAATRNVTVH
jgi:uncharacterized delta-60 repeat protein